MNVSSLVKSITPSCGSVPDHLPRNRSPLALLVHATSLPVTSSPSVMRSITPCKARATAVAVGVAVAVGAGVAVAVAVAVGVGVKVAVGVGDGLGVRVAVGVGLGVGLRRVGDSGP